MAQGFQPDSCSMTAQTSAGSRDCPEAVLRASVRSCDGALLNICERRKKNGSGFGKKPQPKEDPPLRMAVVTVEIDEADEGRFVERNSLPRGDFVERVVNVRQMIGGDIANEGAHDFVVAHAAMHPAKKQNELRADRKDGCENAVPVGGHREILLGKVKECAGPAYFPAPSNVCAIGGARCGNAT